MTTGKNVREKLQGEFIKSKQRMSLTPGDMIRIAREMNALTQEKLSQLTGLKQSTISSLEKNRINLGVDRAKILAIALKVHPSILLFPQWDEEYSHKKVS